MQDIPPGLIERLESRGRGQSTRRMMLFAALGGMVAASGQAPLNLWPLALVGFGVLFALFRMTSGWRRAAWIGWAAGTGYFLPALSWIVEPFLVDIARHGWMAPFAILFMAGGLALFWALAFGVARALGGRALAWIVALIRARRKSKSTHCSSSSGSSSISKS